MKKNLLGISMLTLVGLYILLSVIIIGLFIVLNLPVHYGILISIVTIIIQFLISPFLTDLSMKWFYHAKFDAQIPEYLTKFIQDECAKYNMKYPRIGFIDDGSPNAFTYGHTKNDARIVLTRGIFDLLTEEEVLAVVAHELGHVTHYDMLFMTAAALVPLVLYYIYEICSSGNSDSDSKASQAKAIISIVAYLLYIVSQYIVLWLSRTREYYADEFSIQETKNPNSLASSLVKIGFGLVTSDSKTIPDDSGSKKPSTKNIGALGIFDAKTSKSLVVSTNNNINNKELIKNSMKWEMWNPWGFICELNSTHPLISKRLINISAHSKEYNQEPFITFDLVKPESYVDDFFIELLICYAPIMTMIIGVLLGAFINKGDNMILFLGGALLITAILCYIKFKRAHKSGYQENKIANLLGEVKVSNITSIPCTLEGNVIGRGNPGCIFSEDFILRDETGIIFLDYNQPLTIINKIFAIFKSKEYMDKKIKVKGWYRRCPVPYVEIYEMEIDGKTKKIYTYYFSIALIIILAILGAALIYMGL